MSYFSGTIYSKSLNMDTGLAVILPQDSRKNRGIEPIHEGIEPRDCPKTLVLLHGLSDNYTVWALRTSILRYAEDYGVAVLMPEVQRSFYQNMKNGLRYSDYVNQELPELASKLFHISTKPDDYSIAGLSMGGYGALYYGLTTPSRYHAIGAFSSACDIKKMVFDESFANRKELKGWPTDRTGIFGEKLSVPSKSEISYLIDKVQTKQKKPKVYMAVGTEDFLYSDNQIIRKKFENSSFEFKYDEWSGIHEWGFWDKAIQLYMKYIYLSN